MQPDIPRWCRAPPGAIPKITIDNDVGIRSLEDQAFGGRWQHTNKLRLQRDTRLQLWKGEPPQLKIFIAIFHGSGNTPKPTTGGREFTDAAPTQISGPSGRGIPTTPAILNAPTALQAALP